MTIDSLDIYNNIDFGFSFVGGALKLFVGLLLFCIIFYALMLVLKMRVLMDTINISESKIAKLVIAANVLITAGGAVLAFILILL